MFIGKKIENLFFQRYKGFSLRNQKVERDFIKEGLLPWNSPQLVENSKKQKNGKGLKKKVEKSAFFGTVFPLPKFLLDFF